VCCSCMVVTISRCRLLGGRRRGTGIAELYSFLACVGRLGTPLGLKPVYIFMHIGLKYLTTDKLVGQLVLYPA
jgi:hypothetical protein